MKAVDFKVSAIYFHRRHLKLVQIYAHYFLPTGCYTPYDSTLIVITDES